MLKEGDIGKKNRWDQTDYILKKLDPTNFGEYFKNEIKEIKDTIGVVEVNVFLEVPITPAYNNSPRNYIFQILLKDDYIAVSTLQDIVDFSQLNDIDAEFELRAVEIKEGETLYEARMIHSHWCPEDEVEDRSLI